MKNHRILRCMCILLFTAIFFISCSADGGAEFPFVTVGGSGSADESGYSEYNVVVSRSASGDLMSSARTLCEKIKEGTGVNTVLCYDDELSKTNDSEWNIYIGNVDVKGVKEALRSMRSNDYICRSFDDKTVIGGRNDVATVTAIDRFIKEILPASDSTRLIPDGGGFEYRGVYAVSGLYAGDVFIGDFDIIVEDGRDLSALQSAYFLRNEISESFGYWLDIKSKKDSELGKNICIYTDKKCEKGIAELECVENSITLKAADGAGHLAVADEFLKLLGSAGSEGELHVELPRDLYVNYEDGGSNQENSKNEDTDRENPMCMISVAALDLFTDIGSVGTLTGIRGAVRGYESDIALLGSVSEENVIKLNENLKPLEKISDGNECVYVRDGVICAELPESDALAVNNSIYKIRCDGVDFLLVYLSGSVKENTVIDIESLIGDTDLPVVVISYTRNNGKIMETVSRNEGFDTVAEEQTNINGVTVSYKCCADTDRLKVEAVEYENYFGFRGVSVSIS